MDRLPAVALAVAMASGCGSSSDGKPPPITKRRVDSVAKSDRKIDLESFCDKRPRNVAFKLPPVASPALKPPGGWRWLNVWATWCKPCVEELPMLGGWRERFERDHLPLELTFLSVDDPDVDVAAFRAKHKGIPDSLRLSDEEALTPWLSSLGIGEDTALPIQLFADDKQKLRCVRIGPVSEEDYAAVKAIVQRG